MLHFSQQELLESGAQRSASLSSHRVLRNTYGLLALSMIPTVLGAYVGLKIGGAIFPRGAFLSLLFFLGISFGFFSLIERYKNRPAGLVALLGFTFFMGLMLSRLLGAVLGLANGPALTMMAFGGTSIVFSAMALTATLSKRDFSGLSQWLFAGVIILLLGAVANIWLQLPALALVSSAIAVPLFSAYLLYDLQRVVRGGETNYVMATLAVYLDLYNVFSNLLALLGMLGGSNRE